MGMVREFSGRPVRYERNESYLRWRRVEQIRTSLSVDEIVSELTNVLDAVKEYREQLDAEPLEAVSLVDASRDNAIEEVWEALSTWKTLERRATLLDAARRDKRGSGHTSRVDA